MNQPEFYRLLSAQFPFNPTVKQDLFFKEVSTYILNADADTLFVLKGYAGTGKTTVVSTLVNQLAAIGKKYVLLAPTGRAAKVIAAYSGRQAYTIHKKIYYPKKISGGGVGFTLAPNKHKDTVFFIDEASMISDAAAESTLHANGSLLDDLVFYVQSGVRCKLILLGDTAQLPPVNVEVSPALDVGRLKLRYGLHVHEIEFDEVMRQEEQSGILANATALRQVLHQGNFGHVGFTISGYADIVRLSQGHDIQDAIQMAYGRHSVEDTAFIVRSNKRANQYNQQIRLRILDRDSIVSAGDFLMVVKNNYFWLKESQYTDFIANGDIIEVLEIYKFYDLYGFSFVRVKVRLIDYPDQPPFETVLLLDTLSSETPALGYEDSNKLYQEVLLDYSNERSQYRKIMKVKQNEYFNALQVKYAYAITCHKAQGGQWNTVFIEQPYLPNGPTVDYVRWLYTAVTRAREKLYLIGFADDNFN
jgi:ATP-dependent exoDNAse (exonuclease V) alpha subunit